MDNKKIGLLLAYLRKKRGLTQANLAELFNVTHQAISRWELGESLPDVQALVNLATFYNISVDEILSGDLKELKSEVKESNVEDIDIVYNKMTKKYIIAYSLGITALILFYGVTLLTYYELLGFSIQMLLLIISTVIILFGISDFHLVLKKLSNDEQVSNGYLYCRRLLKTQAFIVIMSMFLALPYILLDDRTYVKAIITLDIYFIVVWWFILYGLLASYVTFYLIERFYDQKYHLERSSTLILIEKPILLIKNIIGVICEYLKGIKLKFFAKYWYYVMAVLFMTLNIEQIMPLNLEVLEKMYLGLLILVCYDVFNLFIRKNDRLFRLLRIAFSLNFIVRLMNTSISREQLSNILTFTVFLFMVLLLSWLVKYIKNKKEMSVQNRIQQITYFVSTLYFYIFMIDTLSLGKWINDYEQYYYYSIDSKYFNRLLIITIIWIFLNLLFKLLKDSMAYRNGIQSNAR